jgi:hypothetical protein
MQMQLMLSLLLLCLAGASSRYPRPYVLNHPTHFHHSGKLPPGFMIGVGTAACQIEGGWDEGGRSPSIWDVFAGIDHGHTGKIACDHFHRFRADVRMLAELGIKHYRFR